MLSKRISILFLFVIFVCLFNFFSISAKNMPLYKKIVYLDPGHGGIDPGCVYKKLYEKTINLEICNELKKQLEKTGAKVYMTRYGDYDLSSNNAQFRKKSDLTNRARIINKSDADIYISIHLNSTNSSAWYGPQVFYDDVISNNQLIAKNVQEQLNKDFKSTRKYSEIKGMLFNRQVTIPGILVEVGFLSNPNDRYLLNKHSYQKRVAISITKAIIKINHFN